MSDQKRVLLAVVLSIAVLWLYTQFLAPPPPKPTQPQQQAQTTPGTPNAPAPGQAPAAPGTAAPPPAAAPTSPAAPAVPAAPAASQAQEIKVETPLYSAVFSERGATLKKMVLKKYYQEPEEQGGNFVLLDLAAAPRYSLGLDLPPVDPHLTLRNFTADASSLTLNQGGTPKALSFTLTSGGVAVTKTYTFDPATYAIKLTVQMKNTSGAAVELTPEVGLTEKLGKEKGNSYAFTGLAYYSGGSLTKDDWSDLDDNPVASGTVEWAALSIPYFMGAVAPEGDPAKTKRSVRGAKDEHYMYGYLVDRPYRLEPGQAATADYLVYYGPRDLKILEPLGHDLTAIIDFGWFDIIAQPFLVLLNWLYSVLGNYGIAIAIITILTKIIFFPLAQKSYKSMRAMQQLQPQVKKLREKYGDDKQRLNQEMMQLYKTYKVNPVGGCLPMLVQIPVFIAFYQVLGQSIELRHAPFFLWINDLSAPDRLPIGFDIPYVGNGLPVLTLLMGASMFIQQKMTPSTGDPTQQKMMMLMPIVFTFVFINFPSGLVWYWLVNNVLSIAQQYWTNKQKA